MRGVIALAAAVAFAVLSWDVMEDVRDAGNGQVPSYGDWDLYLVTALSALVGGVVAVAFGQTPPPKPPDPVTFGAIANENFEGVARSISFGKIAGAGIGIVYVLVYFALGLAACIVWRANPNEVSQPVQNLALTFIGMVLPIAQGFFSSRPSQ